MPRLNARHADLVLDAIRRSSLPRTPAQVAEATGVGPGAARKHLERLQSLGLIARPGRGLYAALPTDLED